MRWLMLVIDRGSTARLWMRSCDVDCGRVVTGSCNNAKLWNMDDGRSAALEPRLVFGER